MQEISTFISAKGESLAALFLQSVKRFPHKPALWAEEKLYTYSQLWESAFITASILSHFPEERCIIFSQKNFSAYSAVIAILLSGKTYVPLNPDNDNEINLNLLIEIDTNLIIVENVNHPKAKDFLAKCRQSLVVVAKNVRQLSKMKKLSHHFFIDLDSHAEYSFNFSASYAQYAYLMFTSGSSGQPKGIRVSHQNVLHYVYHTVNRCRPCEEDRFSQLAELTFDFSVHDLFVAWSVGACVYSMTSSHLIFFKNFMEKHALTFWASVPSVIYFLQKIGQLESAQFITLRRSLFCGETLPSSLAAAWQEAAPNSMIYNLYGPTEATVACTEYLYKSQQNHYEPVPIGKPFPKQHIKIINAKRDEVTHGEIGELCLSGPQVVNSYWRNPELTRDRFVFFQDDGNCWYRTYDLVKWNEAGQLVYQGRLDDQLKIHGHCVSRVEVELALQKIAETVSVAVVPWPASANELVEGVVAFISHSHCSPRAILQKARSKLPRQMVPIAIIEIPFLPFNVNGKTNYSLLKEMLYRGDYEIQRLL